MFRYFIILLAAFSAATGAFAAERVATNAADLHAAIENARSGDHIILESGEYGALIVRNRQFSPPLSISAASRGAPATFQSIMMMNANGIMISEIDVVYGPSASPLTTFAVEIRGGADISLANVSIVSSRNAVRDDDANGVMIRDSARISIKDSRISDAFRGVVIFESADTEILRTSFQAIGSDGIALRGSQRVLIADNLFTEFKAVDPVKFHPDAIQIWSRHAARAAQDVVIRGNVVRRGAGDPTQGIFVKSPELPTHRLIIEENIVEQSMGQGIYVQGASGVTIRSNTIIPFDPRVDRPGIDIREPFAQIAVVNNITIAARMPTGIDARDNEIAGLHNARLEEFLRARLAGGGRRDIAADYAPLGAAGAHAFNRELWTEEVARVGRSPP